MPEPWEITEEEARAEGERLRERLAEADRIAAPLFVKQSAERSAEIEANLRKLAPIIQKNTDDAGKCAMESFKQADKSRAESSEDDES